MQRLSKFNKKHASVCFNYSNEGLKTFIIEFMLVMILNKRLLILLTQKRSQTRKTSNPIQNREFFSLKYKLVSYETHENHSRIMFRLCKEIRPFIDIDVYRGDVPQKIESQSARLLQKSKVYRLGYIIKTKLSSL